jgi:hypothetical protein
VRCAGEVWISHAELCASITASVPDLSAAALDNVTDQLVKEGLLERRRRAGAAGYVLTAVGTTVFALDAGH